MSAPAWFDYQTYFNNKLAQLQELEPTANWTPESLTEAFTTAKYSVTADGMYKHFVDYGNAENISPSPFFDYDEYMANKLAQLQADEPEKGWTPEMVEDAFEAAGLSAWDHYLLYGQAEGISPSASFDTNAYLDAKLEQLRATEPNAGWDMPKLIKAFQDAGLNPIEHYVLYGQYENLSYTPDGPVKPATDTLTVERDVLNLGAGDQIVEGVVSALSAENTLNADDYIDGGEGNDTLRVTLDSNFNGFKVTTDEATTGGVKNVENVELINNGSIARTFSAKGIDGATTYTLSGEGVINLKDLGAAGVTVNVNGLQKDMSVGFTADAVKGDNDSMTFGLTNVGAAETADAKGVSVKLSATDGLESLNIKATGSNYVDLSGVKAEALTVTGAGSLTVDKVAAELSSVDASAATGNVDINLSTATKVTSIKGGAGDDTFTVTSLAADAVLDGGAGNDTLILEGVSGAMQPTLSGFETIGFKGTTKDITLSAKNAQDFTSLQLESVSGTNGVLVSGLTGTAFTVNSNHDGGTTTVTNMATIADAVDLTINVNATDDATATQEVSSIIKAAKATNAVINVGANVKENGSFELAAAQSVQLNVASSWANNAEQTTFAGTITAGKAESLEIKAEGNLGVANGSDKAILNVANASSVTIDAARGGQIVLNAANATDVNLTANGTMNILGDDGASSNKVSTNLSNVQSMTINQQKGTLTLDSTVALSSLSSLTVSGEGSNSGVKLGDLGGSGDANSYDVTVTAIGLAGKEGGYGFEAGDVTSAQGVTLDFSQMTGNAKVTGISAENGDVTIITSDMANTEVGTVSASGDITVDASGKMGNFTATGFTASGDINLTFDGSADIALGALSGDNVTLDASGYLSTVNSGASTDEMTVSSISGDSVTIFGSELAANVFSGSGSGDITANTLNYTGGIAEDTITLTAGSAKEISATLNTGLGDDSVTVNLVKGNETLKLSGDLGGDDGDSFSITNVSGSSVVTIDLSELTGYTQVLNVASGDGSNQFGSLEKLILGGGKDIVTFGSSDSKPSVEINGFSATDGDVFDVQALFTSGSAPSGDFTFLSGGAPTSAVTVEGAGTSSLNIVYYDTDANMLYIFGDVSTSVANSYDLSSGAEATIKLTGLEGDLTEDNFLFEAPQA